jgi:ribokinase
MSVVVFGSINMDLVVRAARLPSPGQTIIGQTFFAAPGGKGANQAVACARLGVDSHMIGRIGADSFGDTLRRGLAGYGVDTSGVGIADSAPSGVALITVDDSAENTIVVIPGANGLVDDHDLQRLHAALDTARVLLLQLEVPLAAVMQAAQAAHQRGITVILDPAPAQPLPADLYPLVHILTPNESEAESLVGFAVRDAATAARAAQALHQRGIRNALIKMGAQGVYWSQQRNGSASGRLMQAFPVEAVDTVAAGDAFNGGVAVALHDGLALEDAIQWGLAAGAISVTRHGAQPSMPTRAEVMAMLATQSA